MAYDTAYAMSDQEDDESIGLYSSSITFGKHSQKFILTSHLLSLCFWSLTGYMVKINPFFYIIDITRFGFLGESDGSIFLD